MGGVMPETNPLDSASQAYLLQEADLIGGRIKWYLEQQQKLESLGIMSTGAIWAFAISIANSATYSYIIWLPAVMTILLFAKSLIFTKTINEAFQYLFELEVLFRLPDGTGWVHFFRKRSSKYKRRWRFALWTLLLLSNILIPIIITSHRAVVETDQSSHNDLQVPAHELGDTYDG